MNSMEDFTLDQINGITNSYNKMAYALNKFQITHWSELTHEQQLDINAYQNSLLNRIQDLQQQLVRPAFNDATEMAMLIQQANNEAIRSLPHVDDPIIALNMGALSVALASYVARTNLRGIQTALRELDSLVKINEQK